MDIIAGASLAQPMVNLSLSFVKIGCDGRPVCCSEAFPEIRNHKFEFVFLLPGVRCELDLGEGGFADEIAAAPPGGFTCWRTREDWPPSLWPNHGPAGIGNESKLGIADHVERTAQGIPGRPIGE